MEHVMPLFRTLCRGEPKWAEEFVATDDEFISGSRALLGRTWFFRDMHINRMLCNEAGKRGPENPLHIAFAGCALACDANSFLIQADSEGLSAKIGCVDAFDRSERFSTIARTGRYPNAAAAQIPAYLREKYTEASEEDGMFQLTDPIHDKLRVLPSTWVQDWVPPRRYNAIVANNILYYIDNPEHLTRAYDVLLSSTDTMIFNSADDHREFVLRDALQRHGFGFYDWNMRPAGSASTNPDTTRVVCRL